MGKMQAELDRMFKETGHQNTSFVCSKACLKRKKKMRTKDCYCNTLSVEE
jgi:hypothetical protein